MSATIDHDLQTIIGGQGSPDHLGPAAYQQLVQRVGANPQAYVQALERRYLTAGTRPLDLADLHLANLIPLVGAQGPALRSRLRAFLSAGAGRAGEQAEDFDAEGEPTDETRRRRRLRATLSLLGPG